MKILDFDIDRLTEENLENLRLSAEQLSSGNFENDFDMSIWSSNAGDGLPYTRCGSHGCVVGTFTSIEAKYADENWAEYSERVFGICHRYELWEFLFSDTWASTDYDTASDAAYRINLVLSRNAKEIDRIHEHIL